MKEVMEFCSLGGSEAEPERKGMQTWEIFLIPKVCDLEDSFMREEPGLSGNNRALWVCSLGQKEKQIVLSSTPHPWLPKEVGSIITIL